MFHRAGWTGCSAGPDATGGQRWGDSRCSADLTVLDTDPVTAAPEQLDGIGVTRTWVGGTLRYQRP